MVQESDCGSKSNLDDVRLKSKKISEIIAAATQTKHSLLSRARRIRNQYAIIADWEAGLDSKTSADRIDTIRNELTVARQRQESEMVQLAVFRFVLGLTDEIDIQNLELDR